MLREACKQFPGRVVLVHEFRTSRVSSARTDVVAGQAESFRWLRPVRSMATRSRIRGLMCSTSNVIRFYDRDVSAALNIRRIAAGPGRPRELSSWLGRPAMPNPGRPGQEWVAVTGASGNIANHLLFMLASGEVYGKEQPIALQLLGSERSRGALEGVAMELEDSLYPLLREASSMTAFIVAGCMTSFMAVLLVVGRRKCTPHTSHLTLGVMSAMSPVGAQLAAVETPAPHSPVSIGIDPAEIFSGADWALMVGAKPRGPGMERADLLNQNGEIFQQQGRALNESADPNCKIIVVGNPCNTNALIAMENAPRIPRRNFHALTRLDENRAKCQLALKAGKFYTSVSRVAIWGNHSTTQVPDFLNAKIGGLPAVNVIRDNKWFKDEFTPQVAQRGGALIKKWGKSSAASTAVSVADAIRSLVVPTPPGDCFSTAVCSDGNPYGIKDGLVFSFPCRSKGDGDYEICNDFILDDWLRQKLAVTEEELSKERDCVSHLTGRMGGSCDIRGKEDTSVPGEM
ncbi:hypothetical protein QJQ45_008671 [Haematococcus lacustris]|nr:hypothetical protein QJQ45_008671 [Haematococcus lacustris]